MASDADYISFGSFGDDENVGKGKADHAQGQGGNAAAAAAAAAAACAVARGPPVVAPVVVAVPTAGNASASTQAAASAAAPLAPAPAAAAAAVAATEGDKLPRPSPIMSWARIAAGGAKPAPNPVCDAAAAAPVGASLSAATPASRAASPPGVHSAPSAERSPATAAAAVDYVGGGGVVLVAPPAEPSRGEVVTGGGSGATTTPERLAAPEGRAGVAAAAAAVASPAPARAAATAAAAHGKDGEGALSATHEARGDAVAPVAEKLETTLRIEQGQDGGAAAAPADPADEDADVEADAAAADLAAKAKVTAEVEAKAAEEDAAATAERVWRSLLQMLGTEDVLPAAGAGGVGAGLAGLGGGLPPGGLVHRGLVNTGNTCFRNAVLQALLACEPFVEVLFRAAPWLRESVLAQDALPTWSQLARFAAAFEPPKPGAAVPMAAGGTSGGGGGGDGGGGSVPWTTAGARKKGSGRRFHRGSTGVAEPVWPDEAMSRAFGAFRAANMGEQEDAQEFLAFFLDQLHEEIVEAKKKSSDFRGSGGGGGGGGGGSGCSREDQEEDAWLEVGKGGAKAVINKPDPRGKVFNSSVVTGLFYGMFRSEVKKGGSSNSSVTLEAFHCLQLDLDSNFNEPAPGGGGRGGPTRGAGNGDASRGGGGVGGGAWGGGPAAWVGGGGGAEATVLESALEALFRGENVDGVKGKRNVEVKASRTLTLEQPPKVLTLHLKQFFFHPQLGPRKLARRVRYPLELEVPRRIMSPALLRKAETRGPLKYRLNTVVLHHGRSIHGGHYTALVRDPRGEWKHYDDQHVTPEMEAQALNPMSGHPYLLLYTRM